ncbi:ABC transporter G family member 11 [Termitomyces sp. J132]|nr:ABC transporter G family member 11 [Termitomyces sp. J132]
MANFLSFSHLSYEVKARDGAPRRLLDDVSVEIKAGELLAIMVNIHHLNQEFYDRDHYFPRARKSTLLDVMAFRKNATEESSVSPVRLNNRLIDAHVMHRISNFVEQEDALLGALTVRESITYALRLHLPLLSRKEVTERVRRVIAAVGLQSCAEQRIGTPISRGVSGGKVFFFSDFSSFSSCHDENQDRSVVSAMVTYPTIWIHLGQKDSTINDRLSVHFYSVAFLAFMSVAGIPSFLEERSVYYRESKNGLYGALPFVIANTLVNIPFLFGCTVVFTLICYWAIVRAVAFFRFLAFLFLAILVAESQVLVVASILPVFVAALAISAFINGFWMSVGGYFIKARSLPRFWYFSFHFMDYQKYAFELIVNVYFRGLVFQCQRQSDGSCACAYPSSAPASCTVSGEDVLSYLEIEGISYGKWSAILISIFLIFRIM